MGEPTHENAAKVVQALAEFGFTGLDLQPEDFAQIGQVVQLGYPPNRIDIINSPDGVDFTESYNSRIEIEIENVKVNVINLDNLKKNKIASGRAQDIADVENLSE